MVKRRKSGKGKRKQKGGAIPWGVIPPLVSGANTILKEVKPATKLLQKFPNLKKVPVIGTLLSGAQHFGYGNPYMYGQLSVPSVRGAGDKRINL